jgi:antitoxin YefM
MSGGVGGNGLIMPLRRVVFSGCSGGGKLSLTLCKNLCNDRCMEIVTYSETRANLKAIMDRVVNDHTPIAITRQRGKPVVMVDLDDWNSMQETRYLLASPKNAKRLLDSIAEIEEGNVIEVDPKTMKPIKR